MPPARSLSSWMLGRQVWVISIDTHTDSTYTVCMCMHIWILTHTYTYIYTYTYMPQGLSNQHIYRLETAFLSFFLFFNARSVHIYTYECTEKDVVEQMYSKSAMWCRSVCSFQVQSRCEDALIVNNATLRAVNINVLILAINLKTLTS